MPKMIASSDIELKYGNDSVFIPTGNMVDVVVDENENLVVSTVDGDKVSVQDSEIAKDLLNSVAIGDELSEPEPVEMALESAIRNGVGIRYMTHQLVESRGTKKTLTVPIRRRVKTLSIREKLAYIMKEAEGDEDTELKDTDRLNSTDSASVVPETPVATDITVADKAVGEGEPKVIVVAMDLSSFENGDVPVAPEGEIVSPEMDEDEIPPMEEDETAEGEETFESRRKLARGRSLQEKRILARRKMKRRTVREENELDKGEKQEVGVPRAGDAGPKSEDAGVPSESEIKKADADANKISTAKPGEDPILKALVASDVDTTNEGVPTDKEVNSIDTQTSQTPPISEKRRALLKKIRAERIKEGRGKQSTKKPIASKRPKLDEAARKERLEKLKRTIREHAERRKNPSKK